MTRQVIMVFATMMVTNCPVVVISLLVGHMLALVLTVHATEKHLVVIRRGDAAS